MSAIQIIIIVFALFALTRTVLRFREGRVSPGWGVLWVLVWIGLGLVACLPQTASAFARFLGVGRGVDAVMYLAVIALFYVVFRVFVRLEKIEHDITLLTREMAVREAADRESRDAGK